MSSSTTGKSWRETDSLKQSPFEGGGKRLGKWVSGPVSPRSHRKSASIPVALPEPPGSRPAAKPKVTEVLKSFGQCLLEPLASATRPPIPRVPAVSCFSQGPGRSHCLPSVSHVLLAVHAAVSHCPNAKLTHQAPDSPRGRRKEAILEAWLRALDLHSHLPGSPVVQLCPPSCPPSG